MNQESTDTSLSKHQVWMKNSGYLYDRLVVHKMAWPSLTVQWLPTQIHKQNSVVYEIITATHKSGAVDKHCTLKQLSAKMQYIYILEVQMPFSKDISDSDNLMTPAKVHIKQKFTHKYQCNRARYSEQNPSFLAVRVDNAPISIYKRGQESAKSILKTQKLGEGFGLQWSQYGLLTADHQGKILFWANIQEAPQKFTYEDKIQDSKTINDKLLVTVGDDGMMCFWDTRTGKNEIKVLGSDSQSCKQLYTVAVNPVNVNLTLSAGQQGVIKLWDMRNFSKKLYKFEGHQKQVLNVQWSPHSPSIFASGGNDSKVKIWDLLRVGFQVPKDNSGTDQLLFTHQGHQDDVLDIGWNSHAMLLASTEEKFNTMQIYQISNCIQQLQYIEDMDFLRQQCLS